MLLSLGKGSKYLGLDGSGGGGKRWHSGSDPVTPPELDFRCLHSFLAEPPTDPSSHLRATAVGGSVQWQVA